MDKRNIYEGGMDKSDTIYEAGYYILIILALSIISIFSYMTYIFYNATKGTYAAAFTIVIPLPILVAVILLFLLLATGKQAVADELRNFMSKR